MKFIKSFIIVVACLTLSNTLFAQSKGTARKHFKQLAYKKAAEAYTNIYNKGDDSYEIISRIADSYYFNTNTKDAEKWYEVLSKKYPNELKEEHLFRYSHSLKGNQKYSDADSVVKKIGDNGLVVQELSDKPNYFKEFTSRKYSLNSFNNLAINTKFSDFGAHVFKDELYFASTKTGVYKDIYKWNEQPFLNLYKGPVKIEEQGSTLEKIEVSQATILEAPIRTKFHESNAIFTEDGKTMYFTRDNYYKGKKRSSSKKVVNLKIYRASLVDGKWSNIVELPFNSNEYSVGHPALSPDEKTLYFASNKPGGFGATDIYKVAVKEDSYGAPVNLGKNINTKGREMFPYVSSDNTFYFSSDGHLGLGGLDVFESLISEEGEFGEVGNLQVPFNSNLDDFSFYIDKANKRGFVSSNREEGKGDDDIYSFVFTRTKRRADYDCKKTIAGIVTNLKTGEILPEATVSIFDEEGKLVQEIKSNEKGEFTFSINCQSDLYKLKGSKSAFRDDLEEVNSETLEPGAIVKLELDPLVVDTPIVSNGPSVKQIVIRPVYFNFDKSGIRSEDSEFELENIVSIMKSHPDLVIRIESHTDSRGSYSYNKRLSQRRANSTKRYITSRGISASRIQSPKGFGESQLLNNCDNKTKCTEEEHQLNRRSYFIIVSGGEGIDVQNDAPSVIDRKPGY